MIVMPPHPSRRQRSHWLSSLLIALLALTQSLAAAATSAKPNIVYILADDLGYTDTATYGSFTHS